MPRVYTHAIGGFGTPATTKNDMLDQRSEVFVDGTAHIHMRSGAFGTPAKKKKAMFDTWRRCAWYSCTRRDQHAREREGVMMLAHAALLNKALQWL